MSKKRGPGHPRSHRRQRTTRKRTQCTTGPDHDEIEEAKKAAHDTLLELMGDNRAGPVTWKILGPEPAHHRAEIMAEMELEEQVGEWLAEHPDGLLVIAFAPAKGAPPSDLPPNHRVVE